MQFSVPDSHGGLEVPLISPHAIYTALEGETDYSFLQHNVLII